MNAQQRKIVTFGSELFEARVACGSSQAALARKAGLSRSYLSSLENDRRPPPSMDVCRRLFNALNLPLEHRKYLLGCIALNTSTSSDQSTSQADIASLIEDVRRLLPKLTSAEMTLLRRHLDVEKTM
jgi:transcriptional regulator with XRE-family HTH domain